MKTALAYGEDDEPNFIVGNTVSSGSTPTSAWAVYPMEDPYAKAAEIRKVSSTGGEKGEKLAMFSLIPTDVLWALAEHYGRGLNKYGKKNWTRGYDWSLSYDAMNRHLLQFWSGESIDEETGTPHIICAAWHAFALAHFEMNEQFKEFDDRG